MKNDQEDKHLYPVELFDNLAAESAPTDHKLKAKKRATVMLLCSIDRFKR